MNDAGRNASAESLLSANERTPFATANDPETDSHPNLIVLVPDDEDDIDAPFYFSDGDEEDDEYDAAQLDWLASSATPLFTPFVYLYLVSPFLGLGAMFIPDENVSRPWMIVAICVFITLSTFARYLWYLLARYLRKIHLEDIVADAFAKGRTKEALRAKLRAVVRVGDWVSKVLLAAIYLRGQYNAQPAIVRLLIPAPLSLRQPCSPVSTGRGLGIFSVLLDHDPPARDTSVLNRSLPCVEAGNCPNDSLRHHLRSLVRLHRIFTWERELGGKRQLDNPRITLGRHL